MITALTGSTTEPVISQAVDFSIQGVPNTVLRDYLRRFRNCGVGYYPNSSFVHLDVRTSAAYWVDYAGPGEAPRSRPRSETRTAVARSEPASGPIEEAGAEVDDRQPTTSIPTPLTDPQPRKTRADITSGASVTRPVPAAAPVESPP